MEDFFCATGLCDQDSKNMKVEDKHKRKGLKG